MPLIKHGTLVEDIWHETDDFADVQTLAPWDRSLSPLTFGGNTGLPFWHMTADWACALRPAKRLTWWQPTCIILNWWNWNSPNSQTVGPIPTPACCGNGMVLRVSFARWERSCGIN